MLELQDAVKEVDEESGPVTGSSPEELIVPKEYNYIGVRYSQGASEQELLSFCASANDIHAWGGVPTKTERFHGGFQRALSDRYQKIVNYFNDGQASPTSIVVAFREGALEVTDLGYPPAWGAEERLSYRPVFAHIRFTAEERDPDTEDLQTLAEEVCAMLKPRLEVSGDQGNEAQASEEEDDGMVDIDAEQESGGEVSGEESGEEQLEIDVGQSKLRAFYDFLRDPERIKQWLEIETKRYNDIKASKPRGRAQKEFVSYTPEQRLRLSLVSLLRPAMIVDGQHRVSGAYKSDHTITFNICAVKDADWVEQVFQFVVLNKLARPISPSFLTALLNTSLTNSELGDIEPRLGTVGIRNTDRVLMKILNHDDQSPFKDMISQPGDMAGVDNIGRISDKGMLRVAKRWYNVPNTTPEMRMFLRCMKETQLGKAKRRWQKEQVWKHFFFAFWRTLQAKYEKEGVWVKREKFNLLYIVTLMTLQDMFLEVKAKADISFEDINDFSQQVAKFFEKVPGSFFKGWEATGLQSGDGPAIIKHAVQMLRDGKQLATVCDESELFRKVPK